MPYIRILILVFLSYSLIAKGKVPLNPTLQDVYNHVITVPEYARFIKTRSFYAADYQALRDYLQLSKNIKEKNLQDFLKACCGFLSTYQLEAIEGVQEKPNLEARTIRINRPIGYGKAAISEFDLKEAGLSSASRIAVLDVKGIGTFFATRDHHSTGVLPLEQAKREFFYEKLTELVLLHSGLNYQTLPTLGILSTGFKVASKHSKDLVPGGILIRQAHLRGGSFGDLRKRISEPISVAGVPKALYPGNSKKVFEIELSLRKYGLTTASTDEVDQTDFPNEFPETLLRQPLDYINLQFSLDGRLLDFGSMKIRKSFVNNLILPRIFSPEQNWKDFVATPGRFGQFYLDRLGSYLSLKDKKFVTEPTFHFDEIDDFLNGKMSTLTPEQFECQLCKILQSFSRRYKMNKKTRFMEQCSNSQPHES